MFRALIVTDLKIPKKKKNKLEEIKRIVRMKSWSVSPGSVSSPGSPFHKVLRVPM